MPRAPSNFSPIQHDRIDLKGGLDQITPTLSLPPGVCRDSVNFEVSVTGGYSRIGGYERFDGHTATPSNASYQTLSLTALGAITAGVAINGQTSGATATCCGVTQNAMAPNTIGYTNTTGVFLVGENIRIGGVTQGVVTQLGTGITDTLTAATFLAGAADVYRALISAVPGSGPVRGVYFLNGIVYAWRDNAGATVENIYKSTTSGWVQVTYGSEISYITGAGTAPVIGNTITGGTSGATGVIAAVVQQTGGTVWVASTGRFILTGITGTFQNGEALKVAGVTIATSSSLAVLIQPTPGGTYYLTSGNLGAGPTAKTKIYGADGVNRGFEFDGTTYVPITTGASPDKPTCVQVHRSYLWFSFGPSLQFSSLALPYQWSIITGAGEIAMPESITNLLALPGRQDTGAMGLWSATNTWILYGSSTADFKLVSFNIGTGALFNTAQNMADTYVMEMRGVLNLQTTLNYGNFDPASLTLQLRPFVQTHRNITNCAALNRERSQYRVFFNDGYALYLTFFNKEFMGAMPILFPNKVVCVAAGAPSTTGESSFFGSDNGFVYQMDTGTSFDGATIGSYFTLTFDSTAQHRQLKRYRRLSLEVKGSSYAILGVSYQLAYNRTLVAQPQSANYSLPFQLTQWDNFTWDSFVWDGVGLAPTEADLVGTAENIAISVSHSSNYSQPFTINTMTIDYSWRRPIRG